MPAVIVTVRVPPAVKERIAPRVVLRFDTQADGRITSLHIVSARRKMATIASP